MVTIKRINVGSAFRVGALVSLLISVISGLILLLFQGLIFAAIGSLFVSVNGTDFQSSRGTEIFTAFSMATACIFFLMYVVFSAIAGGIGAAITAFAYNLVSNWVGGLEIELDGLGKSKRNAYTDGEFFE